LENTTMNRYLILALMLALAGPAMATNNNPPNECGNHGNNCDSGGGDAYGGQGGAGGNGVGVGIGVGVGHGGDATATGGAGGSGGNAYGAGGDGGNSAVVGSGNSSNLNSNKAEGGTGIAFGGEAKQGQDQLQGQAQSSKNTNVAGSASDQTQHQSSYSGANQSQDASNKGVTTIVGGDTTLVERNAPPVFLGAITPTSCGGSFNAGGSSRDGAGGIGFSWVGTECAIRQLGDRYQQMGQVDTACELYRSTKAFQKAAKRNPKLASLDCSVKPAPAAAIVPTPQASAYAPRIPRG
jgi:hypothetical protein